MSIRGTGSEGHIVNKTVCASVSALERKRLSAFAAKQGITCAKMFRDILEPLLKHVADLEAQGTLYVIDDKDED